MLRLVWVGGMALIVPLSVVSSHLSRDCHCGLGWVWVGGTALIVPLSVVASQLLSHNSCYVTLCMVCLLYLLENASGQRSHRRVPGPGKDDHGHCVPGPDKDDHGHFQSIRSCVSGQGDQDHKMTGSYCHCHWIESSIAQIELFQRFHC